MDTNDEMSEGAKQVASVYKAFLFKLVDGRMVRYQLEEPEAFMQFMYEISHCEWLACNPDLTWIWRTASAVDGSSVGIWQQFNGPMAIQVCQIISVTPVDRVEGATTEVPDEIPDWMMNGGSDDGAT